MLHTTKDVARFMEVSVDTVRSWMRRGKLHYVKMGRDCLISDSEYQRFKQELLDRKALLAEKKKKQDVTLAEG